MQKKNRWFAMLLYNYTIKYKQGLKNILADCLSRLLLPTAPSTQDVIVEVVAFTDIGDKGVFIKKKYLHNFSFIATSCKLVPCE